MDINSIPELYEREATLTTKIASQQNLDLFSAAPHGEREFCNTMASHYITRADLKAANDVAFGLELESTNNSRRLRNIGVHCCAGQPKGLCWNIKYYSSRSNMAGL